MWPVGISTIYRGHWQSPCTVLTAGECLLIELYKETVKHSQCKILPWIAARGSPISWPISCCLYIANKCLHDMSCCGLVENLYEMAITFKFNWLVITVQTWANTSRQAQKGRHFADDILKCIFLNEKFEFCLKCLWSLFVRVRLTIGQHWFARGDKPLT